MVKIDHKGHNIATETEFLWYLIRYVITFPYLLVLYFSKKITIKELFAVWYAFGHFFKDARGTYTLIMINILMYIAEIIFLVPTGLANQLILSPANIYSGNILTVITTTFLHSSITHLLGNMLFLFIFGRVVEKYLGTLQFFIIYFGAAIIAHLSSVLLFAQGGIGASGAIAGIVAAAILIRPFYLSYVLIYPLPIFVLGFIQIIGDFMGYFYPDPLSRVGHITHLLGYGSVSITAFFMNKDKRKEMKKGFFINIAFLIVFVILNLIFRGKVGLGG